MVPDAEIKSAMKELYREQSLLVEPSSAVTVAYVRSHLHELPEPVCAILTGDNITREDFFGMIAQSS
jgi:threonine dehydratase